MGSTARIRNRPMRARLLGLACVATLAGAAGFAREVPQPPDRPAGLGRGAQTPRSAPPQPAPPQTTQTPAAPPAPLPDSSCPETLRATAVVFERAAQPAASDPACVIDTPLRLLAVPDPTEAGRTIALPDRPVVACRFAGPFTQWIGQIAAPVLKSRRGADLTAVRTGPGFECRSRNHQAGAKMSAHALGLALDVTGFEFADGKSMSVKPGGREGPDDGGFATIRTAACGWFLTVLGPGSDAYHTDHLHLDIQQHGSSDRYKICQ